MNSDILEQIVSKMDNESIRSLILPDIWKQMLSFISNLHFWYLRTQVLVSRELVWEEGNWKEAYYILSQMKNGEYDVLTSDERARSPSSGRSGYMLYNKEDNALVISVLLSIGLDPSSKDNIAIVTSCDRGLLNSVRRLLQDKRTDPSANDNHSIVQACEKGHREVVSLLLQEKRVDPYARDSEALIIACSKGYLDIVILLLQDDASRGNKIPEEELDEALLEAQANNHMLIVEILLKGGRISSRVRDHVIHLGSG